MRIDGLGPSESPPVKPAAKKAASPFDLKNALADAVAQPEDFDDFSQWDDGEPREEQKRAMESIDDIAARASLNITPRSSP